MAGAKNVLGCLAAGLDTNHAVVAEPEDGGHWAVVVAVVGVGRGDEARRVCPSRGWLD